MARAADGTLFQRADQLTAPGRGGGGGGRRGRQDDEEPEGSLSDRVRDAAKAAGRRKGLTAFVGVICLAMTVVASIFAPKSYEVDAKVLVTRARLIGAANEYGPTPEEQKAQARQFEEQVKARDNILSLIKQTQLVERWDSMRQPHRRLIDQLTQKLGSQPPTDEQKFDTIMKTLDAKLRVVVDDATVTILIEWSDPVAARDIVAAAMKNFQDARYGVEIGGINEQLKILESNVARAQGEVAAAATELAIRQRDLNGKPASETVLRYVQRAGGAPAPVGADPALAKKLEQIRGEKAAILEQRQQRVAQLQTQLQELQQQYADGHPAVRAVKDNIRAAQTDTPALAALKQQETDVLAQIEAAKKAAPKEEPKGAMVATPVVVPVDAGAPARPKSISDVQAEFDTARNKYDQLTTKLEGARIEAQTAEAGFKRRYSVTHPAELPAGPKRPSGLIAAVIGLMLTIVAGLATAAIADRFSGIFFEPRHVRDRLGIPVFGTMKW
ncbi:MAG: hypothetical protein IPF92_27300 [Myxococcales bacterium]|jgi:hypothetical protein|nr:hypothetical protein [Myxococcales bacterium]MBL0194044.1 hypothetical protein [Myxococcales bacterium]HQY64378.1 hypothetical protein [Polyangiaceae bacterium]